MSVYNSYATYFTAAELAKGDPEHLLEWSKRWPNFTPTELACKGSGDLIVNYKALDALQTLRTMWRRPLVITSAFRTPKHNAAVGGAPKSKHLTGQAFDVRMHQYADAAVVSFIYYATKAGFTGFGIYLDRPVRFIHIDTGPTRTWQSGQSRLDDSDDVTEIMPSV